MLDDYLSSSSYDDDTSVVDEETCSKIKETRCTSEKKKKILKRNGLRRKTRSSPSEEDRREVSSEDDRREVSSEEDRREVSSFKFKRKNSYASESSGDSDNLVLESELKRMRVEYGKVLHKLKLKLEENIHLKEKNERIQELNMHLQTQLLLMLKTNEKTPEVSVVVNQENVEIKGEALEQNTFPVEKPLEVVSAVVDQENVETEERGSPSVSESSADELYVHDNGHLMKWKDGKLELAPGIFVTQIQWEKMVASKNMNESKLIRHLAVSLWGLETLRERSVTGTACKRFKKDGVPAKTALTPIKVDAVQNGVRFWLYTHKGKEMKEVLKLSSKNLIRKMLSQKLMDVSKRDKILSKRL